MKSKFLALIASIVLVHAVRLHAISLDSIPFVGRFCADIIESIEEEEGERKEWLSTIGLKSNKINGKKHAKRDISNIEKCKAEMNRVLLTLQVHEKLHKNSDHLTGGSLKAQLLKEVSYQKRLLSQRDECSRMIKVYLCFYEAELSNSTSPLQEIENYLPLKCSWSLYKAKRSVEDQLKRVSKENLNSEYIIKAIDIEIDSQDTNTDCGRMISQYLIGQKVAEQMRNEQEPKQ